MTGRESSETTENNDRTDRELAAVGHELREVASPVEGHRVIVAALRRKAARARRTNWLVVGMAAVLVFAMAGVSLASGPLASDETGNSLSRSSGAAAIVAALGAAPLDPRDIELVASVRRYDTCDGLMDELRTVGAAHVGSRGFGGSSLDSLPSGVITDGDPLALDDVAGAAELGLPGTDETLGTNVIVAGVDEPDIVKATDSLVVELRGNVLRVFDTTVGGLIGNVQLTENSPDDATSSTAVNLLLDGRRAVVFGQEVVDAAPIPSDPSATRSPRSYLTITFVDLADPTSPTVTDDARIEGRLVAVRRVGEEIRMVTTSSLTDLPIVIPASPNAVVPALEQNRRAVAESSVDDWIPAWDRGEATNPERLVACDDVVVPDTFAGVQMTSLVQFDIDGPFEPRATGLLAPATTLTATATDVVIAAHVWVDSIDQADDFTDWSTALHRFVFDDGTPRYVGSGAVDGSIRGQFALAVLDDGTVGAVTADVLPWQSRIKATITVRLLATDEAAPTLAEVGSFVPEVAEISITGGVRFIGDRLLVSSGQDGNIFSVVDLSDPASPRALGSVLMRGTGAYLHPIEGNRVLAIGPTLGDDGPLFFDGVHASLLDLSGLPTVVGEWELDDITTSAVYDHHAFTWWPSRSIAAFGIRHAEFGPTQTTPPPEALFLTVEGSSITPRRITPRDAELGVQCPPSQQDRTGCDDTGPPEVRRVLVVDGAPWLYTSESLEHLDPTTFASIRVIPLPSYWDPLLG